MDSRIDLRSDTMTRPTAPMRRAMAEAEVGDEQRREDPTVNRLGERVADLLGMEDAVFLPSATMANEIAFAALAEAGDTLVGHRLSHPFLFEAGGPAFLARLMLHPLDGPRGMFTADAVEAAIPPRDHHRSRPRILLVENTTNMGGGAVWPVAQAAAVTAVARRHGMACHLDGSRLLNAVVASGTPAREYAAHFDSVTLCFSKGLGAPVGAALAGSRQFIAKAWRFKHLFGGAMRQAGIIAAGALHALDHHVERLADDHANARRLAEAIAGLPGILLDPREVETNIIIFRLADSAPLTETGLVARMAEAGVDFFALAPRTCRMVTHLDITPEMIDEAVARFRAVLGIPPAAGGANGTKRLNSKAFPS
jgi:threonine aldolase